MKNFMGIAALVAASVLAACSGGGSGSPSPVPTTGPTIAPTQKPQTYTVTLKYTGGAEPQSGMSVTRKIAVTTKDTTTATPPPVLLVAPSEASGPGEFMPDTGDSQTLATAQVAPSPSSSPTATWTGGNANVSVTPDPNMALTASVGAQTVNQTSTTNLVASVSIPNAGAVQVSPQVFVYNRLSLSCPTSDQSAQNDAPEWTQGVAFDSNGNAVPVTDPTKADIYVDGPTCYGAFQNTSESGETLHMPYGGHYFVDGYKVFNQFTTSDYQGDLTSATFDTMFNPPNWPTNPFNDNVTFKDAVGRVHFWFITRAELPAGRNTGATKTCNGAAIDGSC